MSHRRPIHIETQIGKDPSVFAEVSPSIPLVLDLDGTLLHSDLLLESFVLCLKLNPLIVFLAAWWLLAGGKARLKAELASRAPIDCDTIPENPELVALAQNENAAGRTVVLATAADQLVARRIAKRFSFISLVLASDGVTNLKAERKAQTLAEAFPAGFLYAGDAWADISVWRKSKGAVVVTSNKRIVAKVRSLGVPIHVIPVKTAGLKVFAKAIRVQQSVKNVLVFAPLLLAGKTGSPPDWLSAGTAFLGMAFVASATYLLNDLFDLADDRKHWTKRNRPLASGRLQLKTALLAIPTLFAWGMVFAFAGGPLVAALTLLYAAVTLGYSFHLKRVPLVDVMVIAGLFSLRLLIGVVAVSASISIWLFVFSMALFLSIALAKRHTEVARMKKQNRTETPGRGYRVDDEPLILSLGSGTAVAAIVFFSLYLISDSPLMAHYSAPQFLWLAPVAMFLWLGRIWLLSQRGELNDDPVAFAVRDRSSVMLGAVVGLAFILATVVHIA